MKWVLGRIAISRPNNHTIGAAEEAVINCANTDRLRRNVAAYFDGDDAMLRGPEKRTFSRLT
jgi:hypothetical protein